MNSKINICNLALAYLGQFPIASLEQENEPARCLKLFYEPVRDEVLRTHNWAFAATQEPLVAVPRPPQGATRGVYYYKYPAQALFIRRVFTLQDPARALPFEERFLPKPHLRVLLTPAAKAQVCYTRRVTEETQFDPAFAKCLALALAADTALAITGDTALSARLQQQYNAYLEEARRSNMSENCLINTTQDAFSEVR